MRKYVIAAFILGGPWLMPAIFAGQPEPPRLGPIVRYACYYGNGHEKELARFDLLIVQPEHYDAKAVKLLKQGRAVVLGYLSIGETDVAPVEPVQSPSTGSAETLRRIPPYYLNRKGDGRPDRNGEWGSYFVDANSLEWKARVLDHLVPDIIERHGMDGLFLDTVDTAEVYPETAAGMVALIVAIRDRYPRMPIVVNRGFTVLDRLLGTVDGVMFECYTSKYDPTTKQSRVLRPEELESADQTLKKVVEQRQATGLRVLLLDYVDPKDKSVRDAAVARARKTGLPYSITNGTLDKLPVDSTCTVLSR